MKYRVIKRCKDKYTKEIYKVGTILELTKKRATEILKAGKFIEIYEEPEEDSEQEPEEDSEQE